MEDAYIRKEELIMYFPFERKASKHHGLKQPEAIDNESIKKYVLKSDLFEFLKSRIQAAEAGEFSSRSVDEIFGDTIKKYKI